MSRHRRQWFRCHERNRRLGYELRDGIGDAPQARVGPLAPQRTISVDATEPSALLLAVLSA